MSFIMMPVTSVADETEVSEETTEATEAPETRETEETTKETEKETEPYDLIKGPVKDRILCFQQGQQAQDLEYQEDDQA